MGSYVFRLTEQMDKMRVRGNDNVHLGSSRTSLGSMKAEIKTIDFWRAIIAECLATFFYVFVASASTLQWDVVSTTTTTVTTSPTADTGPARVLLVAFGFGLSTATLGQMFGHISGGHFNPAITFAMMVTCKVTPLRGLFYIIAQCGGGIAGAALLYGITPIKYRGILGVVNLNPDVTPEQGFGVEFLVTFMIAFTYFATIDIHRRHLGSKTLTIGLAVILAHITALRFTGCGVNPARTLGPAFIMNLWANHWVYWAGPMSGGFMAGLLYEYIFDPSRKPKTIKEAIEELDRDPRPELYGFADTTLTRVRRSAYGRAGEMNGGYDYDAAVRYEYEMDGLSSNEDVESQLPVPVPLPLPPHGTIRASKY